MHRLGERIKKRREYIHLHMSELAAQIGVSSSLLSQIENGKAYPSLFTLKKIAEGLKTTVGELIGENEQLPEDPVLRGEDKQLLHRSPLGTEVYSLGDEARSPHMDILLLHILPGDKAVSLNHSGQDFFHVLEGSIEISLPESVHVLQAGDSFCQHPGRAHDIRNNSPTPARVLWVRTPPLGN